MNPSITYILSLDHSGSTFLQYLLATQTHFLGIGEVNQLAKGRGWDDGDRVCSCGELLSNCQVWQTVESISRSNAIEWYRELTSFLQQKYPQFTHWIDSSKSFEGLEPWLQLHREGAISDIRVLFLVRDVRGWAVSDRKTRQRKGRDSRPLALSMLYWWQVQRQIINQLTRRNLTYQIVSYERLVFQTHHALCRILKFHSLHLEMKDWLTQLQSDRSVVHDVFGNRMKNNPKHRTAITYDESWQYCISVNILASLLIPVWQLNAQLHQEEP
ncbi:MAG: sulfotransferase domain-containing protein [Geitlerinemataceae cyanobacterium]